jgi:hypothetical protein
MNPPLDFSIQPPSPSRYCLTAARRHSNLAAIVSKYENLEIESHDNRDRTSRQTSPSYSPKPQRLSTSPIRFKNPWASAIAPTSIKDWGPCQSIPSWRGFGKCQAHRSSVAEKRKIFESEVTNKVTGKTFFAHLVLNNQIRSLYVSCLR